MHYVITAHVPDLRIGEQSESLRKQSTRRSCMVSSPTKSWKFLQLQFMRKSVA